jgi:glycosyltransferase involved in cell wall biosynthesis
MVGDSVAIEIELTICICTRNRPDDLATAIASVGGSSVAVSQIIVSDDSTDDRTRILVDQHFPDVEFIQGPRRGLCANRNAALAYARGTHVLFIDDDATLGKDFLRTVNEQLGALSPDLRRRTIVCGLERNRGSLISPSDQTFFGYQERSYGADEALNTIVINATVFPVQLFAEIGFDRNLVYGSDEVDLATRAVARGFRIVLCRQAVNEHFPSPVNRDFYQVHVNASRLYVTLKRYAFTQRAYGRALCFVLLAPLHLAGVLVKRNGIGGLKATASSVVEALTYLRTYLRGRPDAPPRAAAADKLPGSGSVS